MRKLLRNDCTYVLTFTLSGVSLYPDQIYEINHGEDLNDFTNDPFLIDSLKSGRVKVGWWENSFYNDPIEGELYLRNTINDNVFIADGTTIVEFTPSIEEDQSTGIKGDSLFLNIETIKRELYNDSNSIFYISDFQPLLGDDGTKEELDDRILNIENIHNKGGWHDQEIRKALYQKPKNILMYNGWLNSFNSATNGWSNENVAQDMSKYNLIVFGDGVQVSSHGDYSNTTTIISRIKELNPSTKIFGTVSVNQTLVNFKSDVDEWDVLGVHGILMEDAGYDNGSVATNGRDAFNEKVDYVHNDTTSNTMICFVNATNMDHIIGTENDTSYPNTTWNSNENESNLDEDDWYLLESFAVNSAVYTSNNGYESKSDWFDRGEKAALLRYTYDINIAAVSVIEDGASASDQFDFMYTSAIMWSLEACGSSDIYYGASSAAVTFRTRPDITNMGLLWSLSPAIIEDNSDSDVYYRYTESGKLSVDFSSSAQTSSIDKW